MQGRKYLSLHVSTFASTLPPTDNKRINTITSFDEEINHYVPNKSTFSSSGSWGFSRVLCKFSDNVANVITVNLHLDTYLDETTSKTGMLYSYTYSEYNFN